MTALFTSPAKIIAASVLLRLVLLVYGAWQDAHSPVKYTDIDYLVFTDAARYVSQGASPYTRDTYRYTPLLAWLLVPTAWHIPVGGQMWPLFSFGKLLFALADVLAGWLMAKCLRTNYGMDTSRALKFASVWLLNPMVANISTRGSSEGLLGVLVAGVLWAVLNGRIAVAGVLLGIGVHFKIYPFVYGVAILWWLENTKTTTGGGIFKVLTPSRITLTLTALATFAVLNVTMYTLYGFAFLQHTYLHHLTRIDHRHNFSPYSTLLYLSASASSPSSTLPATSTSFESLAFIPQLVLAVLIIPAALGRKDLAGAMLAQTYAFVAFNKVCTSQVCSHSFSITENEFNEWVQYFLWYLIFLPLYLPNSLLLRKPRLGLTVAALWVIAQVLSPSRILTYLPVYLANHVKALWLHQGFRLEFLGLSSFVPGLFLSSLFFFAVNCWILGILVQDIGGSTSVAAKVA